MLTVHPAPKHTKAINHFGDIISQKLIRQGFDVLYYYPTAAYELVSIATPREVTANTMKLFRLFKHTRNKINRHLKVESCDI